MVTKKINSDNFLRLIIKKGVTTWNEWFLSNPGAWVENLSWETEKPPYPLIDIDLSNGNFDGMNLNGIILNGACLMNASFRNASLRNAGLKCVEATGANFGGADLTGADLTFTIVHDANFSNALLKNSTINLAIANEWTKFLEAIT